ncbi:MAG TPA: PhnD/SsuA/transferrin family substrate-binding protein [Lamprocystis sp. (in: g-proteobacteria)]|nr:PhnD/SsuA/transferrin family substrate-binding protein [Lamprocystis sp. (in: g-proteobacteria)]
MISRRELLGTLLALGAGGATRADAPPDPVATSVGTSASPLRFGLTPVILDDRVSFLRQWSTWLSARLRRPVVFVQRGRYREILDLLLRGGLDLAWICGYPYVQHQTDLSLIAVPRFQGQPLYRAYVIVGAEASFQSLEDLKGRLFAWSDPDSNSGYLFPRYQLAQSGEDPDRYFRRAFFTWGHRHCVEAMAAGLADGAAVDGYVWETLARREPALTARTRVVLRSPLFGFPPLVAAPGLPGADLETLRRVVLAQADDADGRRLLGELNLDGFSAEGPALFLDIAHMAGLVRRAVDP